MDDSKEGGSNNNMTGKLVIFGICLFQYILWIPSICSGFQIITPHKQLTRDTAIRTSLQIYETIPQRSNNNNDLRISSSQRKGPKRHTTNSSVQQQQQQKQQYKKIRYNNDKYSKEKRRRSKDIQKRDQAQRLQDAIQVERKLSDAIDRLRQLITYSQTASENKMEATTNFEFPTVRECNSAIAAFGDSGDFVRALSLFSQMRKSTTLTSSFYSTQMIDDETSDTDYNYNDDDDDDDEKRTSVSFLLIYPPVPTLVTYSTIMSRAVSLGKPLVALRLWKLMTIQKEFYTNISKKQPLSLRKKGTYDNLNIGAPIVPDVRAVNILMNAYAKLADSESANALLNQMYTGTGTYSTDEFDFSCIPKIEPNVVTWNTLIDACHRAGDLDTALDAFHRMKELGIQPDARTYTSLISTVGRRATKSSGARDPDLAFSFMQEMMSSNIRPNGMTYCALIEVCGRCRRSDLALKGVRMMLRQKAQEQREARNTTSNNFHENDIHESRNSKKPLRVKNVLFNEVGAWTSAINACGKAGRLDTAIRLFHTMSKFGAKPNTVTCGCLADCLLRANPSRVADTLDVLRYMKDEGIEPSEVMYTSLISSAGQLTKIENEIAGNLRRKNRKGELITVPSPTFDKSLFENDPNAKAIELYTGLMWSLMKGGDIKSQGVSNNISSSDKMTPNRINSVQNTNNNLEADNHLVKVFLVFQEMKAAGATADVACYNALLRACARSGDVSRIKDVLRRMKNDGLCPNHTSWREAIRGAAKARKSDTAEEFWQMALTYEHAFDDQEQDKWKPGLEEFDALILSFVRDAMDITSPKTNIEKSRLFLKVIEKYLRILKPNKDDDDHLQLVNVDIEHVHQNQRIMSNVLNAIISLDDLMNQSDLNDAQTNGGTTAAISSKKLRQLGKTISELKCFDGAMNHLPSNMNDPNTQDSLKKARKWNNN